MKSARERVQIVSAYNELGSYRAAAELCGTTPKTVRRVVERQRAGGIAPPRKVRAKNTDAVADLVGERVGASDGRGVISVDDDATRRSFQLDMPRLILNGGTSDTGVYRVTTHDFLTEACLGCIARADLRARGPEEGLARRLGIPVAELRPFLGDEAPLPKDLLDRIPPDDRGHLRGVSGRDVARVVCGDLLAVPDEPAVSAPMLSAAPGVLLAAEVVKRRMAADAPLSPAMNMVATNILTGPHTRWALCLHKRAECECRDPVYRTFCSSRWKDQVVATDGAGPPRSARP